MCMMLCADCSLGVDRETQYADRGGGTSPGTSKTDVCPGLMGRRHKGSRYMQDLKVGPFVVYLHSESTNAHL